MKEKIIIFVCTGNTCRSPMAEAVLRSEIRRLNIPDVSVFSAGIEAAKNGNINSSSLAVLSENGFSVENFVSRTLDEETLKNAYAIVCMTDIQRDILMDLRWTLLRKAGFSEIENNVYSFSDIAGYEIPDPFGREMEAYRFTYRKIIEGMAALVSKLFPETVQPAAAEPSGEETEKTETVVASQETAEKKQRKPRAKPRKRVSRNGTAEVAVSQTQKKKEKKNPAGKTGKNGAKK